MKSRRGFAVCSEGVGGGGFTECQKMAARGEFGRNRKGGIPFVPSTLQPHLYLSLNFPLSDSYTCLGFVFLICTAGVVLNLHPIEHTNCSALYHCRCAF
jgi:hypothetical protein